MSFTPAQRHKAIGLYKELIRTSSQTFRGDTATATAWRQQVRDTFQAASKETDSSKIDEGLHTWAEVIKVLRHNVVQGEFKEERKSFHLSFTKDTELGSNESVKQGRKQQIENLRASKGISRCGGPSSVRQFSSCSTIRSGKTPAPSQLPRPAARFPQMTLLSDGSSIQLTTTSPRSTVRLTRDITNHPLWNPSMERTGGASEDDESGRLGRFRRRFGGAEEVVAAPSPSSEEGEVTTTEASSAPAPGTKGDFGADDLDWMSVGGREARAGSPLVNKKLGKGKK
jgi:ribosomal protein L31